MIESVASQSLNIIGCGNIGSHLASLVTRMHQVATLHLIDSGVYEAKDLRHQDILPGDVGKSKAQVQADRAQRIRPELAVEASNCRVEDLPLGRLRAAVTLSCLDTRISRQFCNEFVHHLGQPWIDAGVSADGLLVRLNSFRPGPGTPCLECSWDDHDYALLEQKYVCTGEMRTFSTNAPSSLGSLAASLQAIEAGKILDGRWDETLVGKEMLLDGRFHHQYVSKQTVNPLCRFDHQRWLIEPVSAPPQEITVEDALGWAGKLLTPEMRVVGQTFSLRRTCLGCGRHYPGLRLSGRLRAEDMTCRGCLEERVLTAGSDSMDYLTGNSGRPIRRMRLSDLGVLPHDILAVGQGDVRRYFEVGMLHEG